MLADDEQPPPGQTQGVQRQQSTEDHVGPADTRSRMAMAKDGPANFCLRPFLRSRGGGKLTLNQKYLRRDAVLF